MQRINGTLEKQYPSNLITEVHYDKPRYNKTSVCL